ncbi:MAG: nuclear transport factor 2 family protein [Blastocatellia bacterium]
MSSENTQQVVADYFAAIRAMDREAWIATFASDGVSHDPYGAPEHRGHDALRQFFDGIAGAFETVGLTEDQVFAAGNRVAVKWTGRGTGRNGRAVTFEGIDVFEFNEAGLIQTAWAYWNPAAMMAELMS